MVQIAQLSKLSAVVHGALIALMLLIVYGFVEFTTRRGINRPLVRAGAISYGFGVVAMVGAALVSGFVITGLAPLIPHGTVPELLIGRQMLVLCGVLNRSCADFAVVAMSVGIFCWSLDLCRDTGSRRAIGVFGCFIGVLCALAMITGLVHLDVHGMIEVVFAQSAWNIGVAALLMANAFGF